MTLYGDALWSSGLFEEAEIEYRDALAVEPDSRPRPPRHGAGARGAQPARRRDERGAGGAAAVAARPRNPPHRRHRSTSGMHKYEEAAAAYTNYVNLLPNKDHSEKADWSRAEIRFLRSFGQRVPFEIGSRHRRQALHRRLPAGERQGRRARQGQRRRRAGLRRRHRRGEHGHHASDGAAARHHADHLHAQRGRRRRRPARPAARADRLARARVAEAAQRALPDQEPAAARHSGEGNREPVAAGARLLDDHRLQDAQADVRQAPARGAGGLRAADAHAPAGHGARHRRRQPSGELRRRHRRRGDLDQPGDRDVARRSRRPDGGSRSRCMARRAGTRTRS